MSGHCTKKNKWCILPLIDTFLGLCGYSYGKADWMLFHEGRLNALWAKQRVAVARHTSLLPIQWLQREERFAWPGRDPNSRGLIWGAPESRRLLRLRYLPSYTLNSYAIIFRRIVCTVNEWETFLPFNLLCWSMLILRFQHSRLNRCLLWFKGLPVMERRHSMPVLSGDWPHRPNSRGISPHQRWKIELSKTMVNIIVSTK